MDLRRLQACIKNMDRDICAKVDENDLQARVEQKDLQSHIRGPDHPDQDAEKDHQAREKEKHLPDCPEKKDPEAQIKENSLLARIREKWAAKQMSASTLTSDDDRSRAMSNSDKVSSHDTKCGAMYPQNKLHPVSSPANALQDSVSISESLGRDVIPKDRFRPSLSIAETRQNSPLDSFDSKHAAKKCPRKERDVHNARDNGQSWQPRQKAMPVNATTSSEALPKVNDFECEVFQEGGESANGKWKNCKKYPGHKDFIPVNEFTLQHLPKAYRSQKYYQTVKSVARVTVRLRVKYNSKDRPDGYLFANVRGTRLAHTGSGVIYSRFFAENIKGEEVPDNLTHIGTEDSGLEGAWAAAYDGKKKRGHEFEKCHMKRAFKLMDKDGKMKNVFKSIMKPADVRKPEGLKDYLKFMCDICDISQTLDSGNEDEPSDGIDSDEFEKLYGDFNEDLFPFLWTSSNTADDEDDKDLDDFFDKFPLGTDHHAKFIDSGTDEDSEDCTDVDSTDDEDDEQKLFGSLNELDSKELKEPEKDNETFGVVCPCCCADCKKSNSPEPKGYYVNVLTARHVVFDKEEAENTIVELFCDDDSESGKMTLFGVDVHLYYHAGDMLILMCATHDLKLILKLELFVENMMENVERMNNRKDTPLAFICSHPHGNFKHVTVGKWTQRTIHRRPDGLPPYWTSYFYDTPTCPGSSGGPVIIIGHRGGMMMLHTLIHLHHGHHEKDINKSSRFICFGNEKYHFPPRGKRERKEQKKARDESNISAIVTLMGRMF